MKKSSKVQIPLPSIKRVLSYSALIISLLLAVLTDMGVPPSPGGTNSGAQCQEYWRMNAGELERYTRSKDPLLVKAVPAPLLHVNDLSAGNPFDFLAKLAYV